MQTKNYLNITQKINMLKLNCLDTSNHAAKYIHGIDIEPLLYRIAKSYMAVIGGWKK